MDAKLPSWLHIKEAKSKPKSEKKKLNLIG